MRSNKLPQQITNLLIATAETSNWCDETSPEEVRIVLKQLTPGQRMMIMTCSLALMFDAMEDPTK